MTDPSRLRYVQQLYEIGCLEPLPALQVAWADREGVWPWQVPGGMSGPWLYGQPVRKGA